LARRLAVFTGKINLHLVPFTETQLFLHEYVQPEKLTILLKRAMLRIACAIAQQKKAQCLITGDSVGQVASQTLRSLEAVNSASFLPILRPLTAMDKQQIIDMAKKIVTYDISIRPYEDCCTLFVAEHPEHKPKASVIEGIEARQMERGMERLIMEAVEKTVMREIIL
jgi:thiamine biosynthesis protein ThiI